MELSCRKIDAWEGPGEESEFCFTRPGRPRSGLRTSEMMNRLLFEGMHDGCILFDLDGIVLRANPSAVRMLGYEHKDLLLGRNMAWDVFGSIEEYMDFLLLLQEGGAVDSRVIRFRCRDQRKITVECNARRVPDAGGKPLCIMGSFRDITEQEAVREIIDSLVEEKNTLLKAINHRIGNNLQILSAMIDLQAEPGLEHGARQSMRECQGRITSIAMVHEKLSRTTDCVALDFGDYLENLAGSIFRNHGPNSAISLSVEAESLKLGMDQVIPCGLILNELVSNSLRHAFPNGRDGRLRVRMHRGDDERINLVVSDDGVGLPPGIDFRDTVTLGFQLVKMLVHQIQGEIELEDMPGTSFVVSFTAAR